MGSLHRHTHSFINALHVFFCRTWVMSSARVFCRTRVMHSARVFCRTWIMGCARVFCRTWVMHSARVFCRTRVMRSARVMGSTWVFCTWRTRIAWVFHAMRICDDNVHACSLSLRKHGGNANTGNDSEAKCRRFESVFKHWYSTLSGFKMLNGSYTSRLIHSG